MDYLKDIVITTGLSLILAMVLGPVVIPMLRRLKVGQSIREDGPETHLKKSGTPTIGGLIMMLALVISMILTGNTSSVGILFVSTLGFGFIGFVDDFIKVVLKRSLGLRAYQKIIGQVGLAVGMSIYFLNTVGSEVIVPFTGSKVDLGMLFVPFLTVVIVATVNSANLTDGLDGLASSVTAVMLITFMLIAIRFQQNEVAVFAGALAGACIGFLSHNLHPAKVFMGDTGSMALGGGVVAVALSLNLSLLIPIACGLYFAEAISVIVQVVSFKTRGKRVLLMAPLHHHYEKKGWKETEVVMRFFVFTVILCAIGFLSVI